MICLQSLEGAIVMRSLMLVGFLGLGICYGSQIAVSAQSQSVDWLDIQVSGRNCPALQASRITAEYLELEFAKPWSLPISSPRRLERGFCQVTINLKPKVESRELLSFTAIETSGRRQSTQGESVRLDLTIYRQGDENHWEEKLDIPAASVDRSWTQRRTISPHFQLSCQETRAMHVKIGMTSRLPAGPAQRVAGEEFELAPVWRFYIDRQSCRQ